MADAWVRVLGTVNDYDGATVHIGVDYETVTIRSGAQPTRLSAAEREEFSRLYFEAERQAEANAEQMRLMEVTMPP